MGKEAHRFLEVERNAIREIGFHEERALAAESLFSLSDEFMGSRGYFEEGYSGKSLRGSYFNGIYDYAREKTPNAYKGIVERTHYMVNALDYWKIRLLADGERLDLGKVLFKDFERSLSFEDGLYCRSFLWLLGNGKKVHVHIERILDYENPHEARQRVRLESDSPVEIDLSFLLDFDLPQWGKESQFHGWKKDPGHPGIRAKTLFTDLSVAGAMDVIPSLPLEGAREEGKKEVGARFRFRLEGKASFERRTCCLHSRESGKRDLLAKAFAELLSRKGRTFEEVREGNRLFLARLEERGRIDIEGDEEDLQGIRYCMFMLNTTYSGYSERDNVPAKGLTGEAYSGHTFWDSETFCLPYFLFTNPKAAESLILFRIHTLEQARKRARMLDCRGACYPVATLNGEEGCALWQHASLQFQASTGTAYALFHHYNVTHDDSLLLKGGMEVLLEISRFLLDRGQWDQERKKFGYYAVMGPDEFKMMVNHDSYTNLMAKFTFELTLDMFEMMRKKHRSLQRLIKREGFGQKFLDELREAADHMLVPFDPESLLYEQNEGFFNLPHIDVKSVPETDFPLYSHWSYDRIYRGDMIKQPAVLMHLFLFLSTTRKEVLEKNYDYYEPRCIHESSLSPSVHSILASALGREEEALRLYGFASRLDLDDWNGNTEEGLHLTSIAAAWNTIVYGFGGFRSDGPELSLAPYLPRKWKSYGFRLLLDGKRLETRVEEGKVTLLALDGPVDIVLYGEKRHVEGSYEAPIPPRA